MLADLVYSRLNKNYTRRFSFYMSGNHDQTYLRIDTLTVPFMDYFQTKDELIEDGMYLVDLVRSLYGATNIDGSLFSEICRAWGTVQSRNLSSACKEVLSGFGLIDRSNDLVNLGAYLAEYTHNFSPAVALSDETVYELVKIIKGDANFNPFADLLSEKDEWLQQMTSSMLRISLIAWLDKSEFRPLSLINYVKIYDGMRVWLQLASPIYGYNNLSIKSNAALALFEFIHYGTENNLKDMNKGMNRHYGGNGGFSEGMGYSQYIWDEVTYAIAVLQEAYASKDKVLEVNKKFLKSAEYVFEMSRPVKEIGLVPIEIDDGCTYNPDYLVWSRIFDNLGENRLSAKFAAVAKKYPLLDESKMLPMMVFGVPTSLKIKYEWVDYIANGQNYKLVMPLLTECDAWKAYKSPDSILANEQKIRSSFKDGLGLISVISSDTDTVTLSIIAENGDLWKDGQGHDQQDNQSITLSSSKKGFLIQDRGYKGYGERWDESVDVTRHYSHNVINLHGDSVYCSTWGGGKGCIDKSREPGNKFVGESEITTKAKDFSGDEVGAIWRVVPDVLIGAAHSLGYNVDDYRTYGGSSADTTSFDFGTGGEEISITTIHSTPNVSGRDSVVTNVRTIMYYGGILWIIDKPSIKGTLWMINSPKESWSSLVQEGVKLYGSGLSCVHAESEKRDSIRQEGSRMDYKIDTTETGDTVSFLHLSQYEIYDANAWTYVMAYYVDGEGMNKTEKDCPPDCQCFENSEGTKKMMVQPLNWQIDVSSVIKDVKVHAMTNGILLASRNGEYWNLKSIGGDITVPNGDLTNDLMVSEKDYYYTDLNGIFHSESVRPSYLPHIPLLLLR